MFLGSGKSTISCAIALCLHPLSTTVGRSAKLSDFIRYGTPKDTKSKVSVTLYNAGDENGQLIGKGIHLIITREFDSNSSKFYFSTSKNPKKLIEINKSKLAERTQALNIQVDNLCSFLAQFRVGEFAEMDPQNMLMGININIYTEIQR